VAGKKNKTSESRISEGMKKSLVRSFAAVALVGGGIWAYVTFTTVAPPNLATAAPEDVAGYLGNSNGFGRMPVENRAQFLADAMTQFSDDKRLAFSRALARLSSPERQVLQDAIFDAGRVQFVEKARQFNSTPAAQRRQFVDNAIREFDGMRSQFAGGPSDKSMADPFKDNMPKGSDGWVKFIVSKTSPRERSEAEQFFNAVTARQQELQDPREKRRFMSGG
jgi:hypothetical protein